nr:MDIS1-interacting receptor like kinase 2-like [Ziziphus jujuba var. spinosa]
MTLVCWLPSICGSASALAPASPPIMSTFLLSLPFLCDKGMCLIIANVLPPGLLKFHSSNHQKSQYLKAFTSEIHALTQIRHLNIVKLYGFCSRRRHSLLVYEFIEGGSLRNVLMNNDEEAKAFGWNKRPDFSNLTHPTGLHLQELLDMLLQYRMKIHTELAYTMEVNKKCDVYSFGVVMLETFKGKHPGDLISSLSLSLSLPSCATPAYDQVAIIDLLDQCLAAPRNKEARKVLSVIKIAFACLLNPPQSRPTMKQVAQELSTQTHHLSKPLSLVSLGELFGLSDSTS